MPSHSSRGKLPPIHGIAKENSLKSSGFNRHGTENLGISRNSTNLNSLGNSEHSQARGGAKLQRRITFQSNDGPKMLHSSNQEEDDFLPCRNID
jgi:hypothetical protein